MIRRTIEGHFDHKTMKTIRLQREEYEWKDPKTGNVEEDGATMLKILFNILKPSLRVGLKEYKKIIQKANAKKYANDPQDMINAMEKAYDEITVTHGRSYDSFMEDLFTALKTFPNKVFVDYVIRLEDDYEAIETSETSEKEIKELVLKVKSKYNNMKFREKWDYVDPSEARIMALTTSLESVQKQLLEEKAKNDGKKKQLPFDNRRCNNVGPSTTIDGVEYEWCDKGHKSRASPNVMYMPKGHDHAKWVEAKKNGSMKTAAVTNRTESTGTSEEPKMILSEKLKAALVTKAMFTGEESSKFIEEASGN